MMAWQKHKIDTYKIFQTASNNSWKSLKYTEKVQTEFLLEIVVNTLIKIQQT